MMTVQYFSFLFYYPPVIIRTCFCLFFSRFLDYFRRSIPLTTLCILVYCIKIFCLSPNFSISRISCCHSSTFPLLSTLSFYRHWWKKKKYFVKLFICGYYNSVFICCTSPVTISGQGFLVSLCNCIALKLVSAINICVSMYSEATDCSVLVCSAQPIISSPMHPPP